MQGLNRTFIMGFLGNAPQPYTSKNGNPYVALNVATHRSRANGDGEKKDSTDWHFIRVWGKQAENCQKYLTKGSAVLVEGYLTQYTYKKPTGEDERRTGINAIKVDFLPRNNQSLEKPTGTPTEPIQS